MPYEFNEEWQVKINSVFPQQKNTIDNIIWVDKYSLYLIVDEIKISNLNELHSRLDGGFKGQNVGRISYYNQIFGFYLMFFGLEAKSTLQTNRNEWSKDFERKFIEHRFLHELCRHILDEYKDQLIDILKDSKIIDLFDFCFNEDKSKISWKEIKMFNVDKWPNYKHKNKKCKIYNKSFKELLSLKKFNFYYIDEFINPNFDISNLSPNDLVYPTSFNSWFKDYFDQDWIDKGGFVSTEKIKGGGEIVRYSTEKTHEIESGDFRIVNQIKFGIQQDRKRINFNEEWMSKIFFREFKALFTKSILVERLVGLENLNVKHLILPFYIFSKDLEAGPNIRIDYLEDNELVRSTWDSRDEEFEDLKFEDFLTLYKKLEEKISKLINTIYPNWIQK